MQRIILLMLLLGGIGIVTAAEQDAVVQRGEYLLHLGGCVSCHTAEGGDKLAGGLKMETPFGDFYTPNITPDRKTGIGDWSDADFVAAMTRGVAPDGSHYYPAFPYASYVRMNLTDLVDLKSYLDTLPVADNPNEAHELKFPWNIRAGIGLWKLVNLDAATVIAVPPENDQQLRGRYLVEGPGHCGECHTPRNLSGGLNNGRWLAGAPNPDGEGKVPNITPDDRIMLDLQVNQDSVGELVPSGRGGFIPSIDTTQLNTQVLVGNGETVVLGGVFKTEDIEAVNKVPFFGDIPYIGAFFRSESTTHKKTETLIFITPRILADTLLD